MNSQATRGIGTYPQIGLNQEQFLFMSPNKSIHTEGIFERIALPVDGHGKGDQEFHLQIAAALGRAQTCGISNPMVIGAIPFNLAQPSSLVIPQRYIAFDREQQPWRRIDKKQLLSPVKRWQSVPEEGRFKQAVKQAIANFQLSDIRKAVLSRILEVELVQDIHIESLFERLVGQNPSATHFHLPLLDGSTLIGASPELLLRKHEMQLFSNPLAGSAKRHLDSVRDKQVSDALLQSAKDRYEHRLVIDDIRRALAPLCSSIHIPEVPSLLATKAMWHLSSGITGVVADPALTALQLACRLHPTPAVCGYPTDLARKLIDLVEPYQRGMFAGMVGWCDAEGNGEWVVTIRCGRIIRNRIELFAGAGIVEDSSPESEWLETQAKLQTMLGALGLALDGRVGEDLVGREPADQVLASDSGARP